MSPSKSTLSRRKWLQGAALGGISAALAPALWAKGAAKPRMVDLGLPDKPSLRPLTRAFPQKGEMILQRMRPPLLETPMAVFDQHILTPNDQFYVRWHWGNIPESVDVDAFRLKIRGHVEREVEFTLHDLLHGFERIEVVAVNQCSGNSRGMFQPSVAGAEWGHGAMGNARWTGVRLRDVLARAGVKAGAVDVRFGGLDEAMVAEAPKFLKSLSVDHACDGEVMIAFAMNGEPLPLLNGFPLRLVVPGWYSTYWIKMLSDIEVLPAKDSNFWMAKAYQVPATPFGHVAPGTADFPKEPISRMVPRSLLTNLAEGQKVRAGTPLTLSGIAMGGDCGVEKVEISIDGGEHWNLATLGKDLGPYSFRRFTHQVNLPEGVVKILCRCTNTKGISQPLTMNWNPNGYMRAGVETVTIHAEKRA
ncbi:oxidase [Novosphingobium umbonatum]|uniref:Oxidase n=1 Tax=Novosphingobium umbonatum TaxID=1908524 RepID=A0A3S2YA05_9SPHN|nr:molybdopterin-dependent oxidoreductase [Novosphingobium umbonatum]RVU05826.1 oxidase [Novosphingobium umbonatum]